MRPVRLFHALLLLAVAGCGPDEKKHKDAGLQPGEECEPTIVSAAPLNGEGVPADAHEDNFGAEPEPFHVHLGWPSSDTSQSISFVWRSGVDTLASAVEFGADGELTERVEGASYLYGGAKAGEGPYRVHEIRICEGLEPNTTYTYRVGGKGHWSPEYSFTTPGEPGSFDTFRVAILGDSRGAYEVWGDLLDAAEAHSPDFYVFSGDMVELGSSQAEWDGWFDGAGELFARKVVVPSHGNHEFLASHYFAQFSLPNNEEWFSVRYGNLHLVSLNDTVGDTEDLTVRQGDYVRQVFGEYDSDWQWATHHRSMYSTCTTHGSATDVRESWEPAFDEVGMDMVFAGHNHIYERSVPIRGGAEASPEEGAVYFVTGGAGAPLYTGVEPQWFGEVANPIEHYAIADFGPGGVDVTVRDLAGNVIDEYSQAPR